MKLIKRLGLGLGALLVLLLIITYLLPGSYRVERSQVIQAPDSLIFAEINRLKSWPNWSPWTTDRDPTLKMVYSGAEQGVGATSTWTSEQSGHGRMQIIESVPNRRVVYTLSISPGDLTSEGRIELTPEQGGVRVTWSDSGELGYNPMYRWFGLMLDGWIGPDFESGLNNLKSRLESQVSAS